MSAQSGAGGTGRAGAGIARPLRKGNIKVSLLDLGAGSGAWAGVSLGPLWNPVLVRRSPPVPRPLAGCSLPRGVPQSRTGAVAGPGTPFPAQRWEPSVVVTVRVVGRLARGSLGPPDPPELFALGASCLGVCDFRFLCYCLNNELFNLFLFSVFKKSSESASSVTSF